LDELSQEVAVSGEEDDPDDHLDDSCNLSELAVMTSLMRRLVVARSVGPGHMHVLVSFRSWLSVLGSPVIVLGMMPSEVLLNSVLD